VPILVVLGAAVFLRESPGWSRLAGVLTALVGISAITLMGEHAFVMPSVGDLYVIGSAACFAAFVIIGRPVFVAFGTIPTLAATYSWAFVFLAPLAGIELATKGIGPVAPATMGLLLFLGVGCSALAHSLWGYALRHLEASQAAVFDNAVPIVGILAATLFLRERPTGVELIGGALVMVGAWLASRPNRTEPPVLVPVPA
jgi:drug/metabolite transporter (DMT)-like permease